jgi:hypothetical protein
VWAAVRRDALDRLVENFTDAAGRVEKSGV